MDMDGLVPVLMAYAFIPTSKAGISLTGSSSYAVLGQSFRFTCTVPGPSTGSLLLFKRDNKDVCTISLKPCQQFSGPAGYRCSCGQSGMYSMDITSVSQRDEGRWECERSQTSNSISLPVYYGPFNNVTVDKSSSLTLTEDVTVSLTAICSADCNPPCSYTWMKGTQQVSDNSDLPVGSFKRGQGGDYICAARNTATGATADSQTLAVNVQWHPAKTTHNCPHWIVLGQTGNCTCQTSDRGNPTGTVQWISPGGQMISFSVSSSVQLNLTSIQRSDNRRNYICRAGNSLPNSNSDTTYVASIAYLDGLNISLHKQDVIENDSVIVTCTAESNPPATMTIEYGNMERLTNTTNNITYPLERVHCLQNGTFNCTAENSQAGNITSKTAQLNVTCSPREDSRTRSDRVVSGKLMTNVTLTANVIANPLPTFTWYKYVGSQKYGVKNVSSGLTSTLLVHIKSEEDYTDYSVVVRNNLGNTSLFFSLTKTVAEVPPGDIIPILVGVGAVVLVTLIIVIIVVLHRRGDLTCTGNSNKKDDPRQGDSTHARDNIYIEGDDGLKYGRDEDGLMYVGVEFGNQATPAVAPERTEEATEYAGIAHGVVGCPLPPDKEDKKE